MRLKITNPAFTRAFVSAVIRFVRPPGISDFDIVVKTRRNKSFKGWAYWAGCPYGGHGNRPTVTVGIDPAMIFPYVRRAFKGYLPYELYTLREALVVIVAHELRHLWQAKIPKGRRVWGARGQFSERDADAYAIHMLRKYRREFSDAEFKEGCEAA